VIFVAEMFAQARWRGWSQLLACITLLALGGYLIARLVITVWC
jgi:hypothetical protein